MKKDLNEEELKFSLTEKFLSDEEKLLFKNFLAHQNLEDNIWKIFETMFKAKTKHTTPLVLRAFSDSELVGAAIIIKCKKTGRALFNNRFLAASVNILNIPVHLWMRFGCCMDMMSNTGFFKNPKKSDELIMAMTRYLHKNCLLTFINDYAYNKKLYPGATNMPSLPHGLIDGTYFKSIDDYTSKFKNIRKKIKTFTKKGGQYIRVENKLNPEYLPSLEKCFLITADKSVMYLPYQDLYLNSAMKTSSKALENVHYFVATLNGQFIGYQAAVKSGKHLNALHGAFDRSMKTTYHAYDILFVKMTEFAIENNLKSIDFGAILNYTKQKMVNVSIDMNYYIFSKFRIVQSFFSVFLKFTNIQGKNQMKFLNP